MKNATEYYKTIETDKQSPGQWLRRKEVKKILDKYDDKLTAANKDAEGEWQFEDRLFDLYSQYITPKEREMPADVKEIHESQVWYEVFMQQYKKETNEEVYQYFFHKCLEDLLHINYSALLKMGVKDVWEDATEPVKEVVASYLSVCNTKLKDYNKKIDTHLMDNIRREFMSILDRGEINRRTRIYFVNKNISVKMDYRNDIVSVPNEE